MISSGKAINVDPNRDFDSTNLLNNIQERRIKKRNWLVMEYNRCCAQIKDANEAGFYVYILNPQSFANDITNEKIQSLDYIDPLQGKLLGVVMENLDYIDNIDPAGYNTDVRDYKPVWNSDNVGKLWFNTAGTKFVNYHQSDIVYNSKYWGTIFPDSTVSVYTWVESDVTPVNYTGPGTPYDLES